VPVVVRECPPIPASLTADCYAEQPAPATNGALAEQWIAYRACAAEQSVKLRAVAALAECRAADK
jgi:hypothetical protein